MKKGILLYALSFLAISAINPGLARSAFIERTSLRPPFDGQSAGQDGDIWVYGGRYCVWNGGGAFGGEVEPETVYTRFFEKSRYEEKSNPIGETNPLSGDFGGRDVYVLDGTPLYFGELTAGGIYGFDEISIMSGTVRAGFLRAASDIYIDNRAAVSAAGEISAGGFIECRGGSVSAGSLDARGIWLDSSAAPLHVAVSGSVLTGYFTLGGGAVIVGGGLYSLIDGGDLSGGITVNSEYARHNAAALTVAGDIVCTGSGASIEIGGGSAFGGLDEAGLKSFESVRSRGKGANASVYESVPAGAEGVSVFAGGGMRSAGRIAVYGGSTHIGGTIESLGSESNVRILGGTVKAQYMYAGGALTFGDPRDAYGANDGIYVDVTGELGAGGDVRVFGGTVLEGIILG